MSNGYIYISIPIISVLRYQRNNRCLNEKKTLRVYRERLIDIEHRPSLALMGREAGVRPSQGMNVWEKHWKGGGEVRGRRKRENSAPEGTKEEGRKGIFLRKSESVWGCRWKMEKVCLCACVYAFVYLCMYVCNSCVSMYEKRKEYL